MKATILLNNLGQNLWLDNITRDLLNKGTLKRYIEELSVTGLTSNPTIFEQAIKKSTAYDADIRAKIEEGKSEEEIFFDLVLDDLSRAALHLCHGGEALSCSVPHGVLKYHSRALPPRPRQHHPHPPKSDPTNVPRVGLDRTGDGSRSAFSARKRTSVR